MNKLKAALSPDLAKFIKESFPVTKKRSALWFFSNELKSNLTVTTTNLAAQRQTSHATVNVASCDETSCIQSTSCKTTTPNNAAASKISRNKVLQMWRNMDPESKRKYFNMAEFDEVRFKEQKSLWVAEVGSLVKKYGSIDRVVEMAPSHEMLQDHFLDSLDKLQKSYEQMIQTESTKMIYKDAIKRTCDPTLETDELISAVPKHHRAILTKPRRPPSAFVLYLSDNMDRYTALRRELRLKESTMKLASKEWVSLEPEVKKIYEDKYDKLKGDYDKSMEAYKAEFLDSDESYLVSASKEKKAFRRSLRRRLRDSSILPVSIRNSFNFFVMDNKDTRLMDLIEVWRELPPEKREKYIKMNQEDVVRYQREIEAYNQMRKTLGEIGYRRKSKSESDIK